MSVPLFIFIMSHQKINIRNARPKEFRAIGKLMVSIYSQLEGFPKPNEEPEYYTVLSNVGELTKKEDIELLVATSENDNVVGAVVYFSDLKNYGADGAVTQIQNASGFRLLAVDSNEQGKGIGKLLCKACIQRAQKLNQKQVIIHSTASMKIAWGMYERLGFVRYEEIDFTKGNLYVYGFKLSL